MSLIIALPRESRTSERRVALDPSRVDRLLQLGLQVRIQADCGHAASFHDDDYQGVAVEDSFTDVVRGADIVVKVVCPTLAEIAELPRHSLLVCIMSAFQHLEEVEALREREVTVLAMDHLPRTTRAQPMDALSSQATVAGYKAALLAAELSPRLFPMLTTAAGTIRPSRVLVIGAGVAGMQAIATSRRLGAQVEAYDIRRAAKEQIESVGARMVDTGVEVEGAGGVARALRKDEKQKQHDVLAEHLARAHVVICAASIPGRRAPRIVTEDMVNGMLPESVIIDMAASTGGNCELTRIGEHFYHNDTLIVGPLNLPSHGAVHASEMYARNVFNMLQLVIVDGQLVLNPEDEIIASCVLLHEGNINHSGTASLLETDALPFGDARPVKAELPDRTSGWLDEADEDDEKRVPADHADTSEAGSMSSRSDDSRADESGRGDTRSGETSDGVLSGRHIPKDESRGEDSGLSESNLGTTGSGESKGGQSRPGGSRQGESRQGGSRQGGSGGDESSLRDSRAAADGHPDEAVDEDSLRDLAALDGVSAASIGIARPHPTKDSSGVEDGSSAATSEAAGQPVDDIAGDTAGDADEEALPRDELVRIDGVGPALQERLYSFGYLQWRQLAEMDDDAIEKLSVRLELDNEIVEQDWRGQARRLMEDEG